MEEFENVDTKGRLFNFRNPIKQVKRMIREKRGPRYDLSMKPPPTEEEIKLKKEKWDKRKKICGIILIITFILILIGAGLYYYDTYLREKVISYQNMVNLFR